MIAFEKHSLLRHRLGLVTITHAERLQSEDTNHDNETRAVAYRPVARLTPQASDGDVPGVR